MTELKVKTLLLHARTFDRCWAHYYYCQDAHFLDRLKVHGYNLITSDEHELDEGDWVIFSEAGSLGLDNFSTSLSAKVKHMIRKRIRPNLYTFKDLYGAIKKLGSKPKIALLLSEGFVGMPENYNSKLHSMFPVIFTWNDDFVDGKQYFKYRWPQSVDWPEVENVAFKDRKLLANVSANKYSNYKREIYSHRREAIRYFERAFPDSFDLYGIGWNSPSSLLQRVFKINIPNYKSYRGVLDSKASVMAKYRFALCYENSIDPGWITEKIFDCMRSGCVPIYLGAPNIEDYVSPRAFIDKRKFASYAELAKYLVGMDGIEYAEYQSAIREYLESSEYLSFMSPSFADTIVDVLNKHS